MRRQALARVVFTLLLAAALVPTLSRALAHTQGDAEPWAQGCLTAGQRLAQVPLTPADAEIWHHLFEHCPLCSLDRDLPDSLPQALAAQALLALAHAGPQAGWVHADPQPSVRWRVQPRAPPALS
jgi:Protein of unknown function (DUF2946)